MEVEEEQSTLLSPKRRAVVRDPTRLGALTNFFIMSSAFGIAHGIITVGLAYASSVFSLKLGAYSTASVYFTYTIGSLLFAAPIVDILGSKKSLSLGFFMYVLYMLAFVLGTLHDISDKTRLQWGIVISGSILGGFGSAIVWVAEGVYFTSAAYLHKSINGVKDSNDRLAAYFAAIYIGIQCLCYALSSVLLQETLFTSKGLFVLYLVIVCLAWVVMTCFVEEVPLPPNSDNSYAVASDGPVSPGAQFKLAQRNGMRRLTAVLEFTFTDPQALAMTPLSITFGFAAVFMATYVDLRTVSDEIGEYAIGYCGSIQTGTIAIISLPLARLATSCGKSVVLALGTICYILMTVPYILYNNQEIGHWRYVAPLFVTYGGARIIWESTLKAIYADFFTGQDAISVAFANLGFVFGLSASIYSLVLVHLDREGLALMILIPSLLILPGYLAALLVFRKSRPH